MALGIRQPQLSKWERGVNSPGSKTIARLASLYRATASDLMGDSLGAIATSDSAEDEGELVQIPATTLAYWSGRFDTMADLAHALDSMMQVQREQFARFTEGVAEFRESGVLPPSPLRPRPSKAESLQVLSAAGIRPAEPPSSAAGDA